jgi:hypothetical protein
VIDKIERRRKGSNYCNLKGEMVIKVIEQESGRTARLCPSLCKTTIGFVYFAHASP